MDVMQTVCKRRLDAASRKLLNISDYRENVEIRQFPAASRMTDRDIEIYST
jgi:hypothetical protein